MTSGCAAIDRRCIGGRRFRWQGSPQTAKQAEEAGEMGARLVEFSEQANPRVLAELRRAKFQIANRVQGSLVARAEKRVLVWLAERMPQAINSDHWTLLGLGAQVMAGANVVTTASNVYPQFYGPGVYDKINDAGIAGGSTFHGSGVNPAFMSEVLPLTLSGLVHRARKIRVQEVSDVNHYASTAPEIMLDHVGFGKSPEEAMNADAFLKGMTAYFSESIQMIVDHLGVTLDRIEERHEVATAKVRVTLDNGRTIEPGTVVCRLFPWLGAAGGKPP